MAILIATVQSENIYVLARIYKHHHIFYLFILEKMSPFKENEFPFKDVSDIFINFFTESALYLILY